MSADLPGEPPEPVGDRVTPIRVEKEMEQSYIDYAMSVIVGRALPDARDGLKPVQRRILYAMHEAGISSNAGHRKCSNIVGDTMGNYHPHGDSAIYDALARMAQDFSLRYPLVDGQGNFGSVDGDPPAAMRYTEARMATLAEDLLDDIEKGTVEFQSNYDDRLTEPIVLPAAVPNLLVNGAEGIAVGMSTKIPPHNVNEIIDAAVQLIEEPDSTVADLVDMPGNPGPVTGPDFPTGANIVGRQGLYDAYSTGRGKIRVRAEMEVDHEEGRIVVTEIPYQENKARRIERIADDVNEGRIQGISDIRDESDREGIRVVIELKRGANADLVRNQLLKHHLEQTYSIIMVALVDGQPRRLDLKQLLEQFVEHRKDVVRRRSQFELDEAEQRAHILEGRLIALDNVDDIVALIRNSEDRDEAKQGLQDEYAFSQAQAEHIVRMQLGSLTSLEHEEIQEEYDDVIAEIERLRTILGDESELLDVIVDELREMQATYGDERRTTIVEDMGTMTDEDLIPEKECIVVLSEGDYVKRMPLSAFDPQHRGGKGIIGVNLKEGDRVSTVFRANSHDYLQAFTTHGQVYQLRTYEIPEMSRTARGKSAVNILKLDDGEEVTAIVNTDEFDEDEYLTMVTRGGYVKRTPTSDFENILTTGIRAVRLEQGDELVDVAVTDGQGHVVIGTQNGYAIRFDETEARAMGRTARGVNGIKLQPDDAVAGLVYAEPDDDRCLLTVTRQGYGKRTPLSAYRTQSRYGKGLIDIKTNERNGEVCALKAAHDDDGLIIMSEGGQIMRTHAGEVSRQGRNTMGVTVMRLDADDWVASVDVTTEDDEANDVEGDVVEADDVEGDVVEGDESDAAAGAADE